MARQRYNVDEALKLIAGDDDLGAINTSDWRTPKVMMAMWKKLTILVPLVKLNSCLIVLFSQRMPLAKKMPTNLPYVTHCCCWVKTYVSQMKQN